MNKKGGEKSKGSGKKRLKTTFKNAAGGNQKGWSYDWAFIMNVCEGVGVSRRRTRQMGKPEEKKATRKTAKGILLNPSLKGGQKATKRKTNLNRRGGGIRTPKEPIIT